MYKSKAFFVATVYALLSALWILFSDRLATFLFASQPDILLWVNTGKGWFFVTVTALLLFASLKRSDKQFKTQIDALEESEARFRTMFNSMSDAVFLHDAQTGAILDVNDLACDIFGYTRDEIKELDVGALSSGAPPYSQDEAKHWLDMAKTQGPQRFEWLSKTKQGRLFWTEVAIRLTQVIGIELLLVSVHDIDERKRIQEDILREKAFSDAVLDSVPGLLYLYDDQGRLVRWNKKHEVLTGYTGEELSRMHLLDWYKDDPKEIENIRSAVERISSEGFSQAEAHLQCKDGSKILFYFTAVPLTIEGRNYFTGIGIDITERKKTEQALRESEARYRSIVENITDVYYRTDKEGRLIMLSPSGLSAMGYDNMDEVLGHPVVEFWMHPAERTFFLEKIHSEETLRDFEITLKRKDGSPLIVSVSSSLYRDHNGTVQGIEGIYRDISARKNAEEALRKNEERLRVIFDTSHSGICQLDGTGRILMANRKMAELFGCTLSELVDKSYFDLLPPEERNIADDRLHSLMKAERDSLALERRYVRPDRSSFWGYLVVSRIPGLDGRSEGLVCIISDITERKSMESSLEASRRLTKAILDSMPSAVVCLDSRGVVTHFNASAELLLSTTFQDAFGQQLDHVFPSLPVKKAQLENVWTQNRILRIEKASFASERGQMLLDILVYPLDAGDQGSAVIVLEDVTERTRLEEIMVQTEKMMSVGGLAAGMAHEINNPLGGIIQSLQVVLNRLEKDSTANQLALQESGCSFSALQDFLKRRDILSMMHNVRESAVRAAHIVTSMLEFSRKSESHRAPLDINILLDKSVELCSSDYDLKKRYDFRKIEITKAYDPNLPQIPGTATQIEQVFMNILRNAAQAMGARTEGGPPPHITLRTREESGFVRIEIEDNGPGMPEDVRRRIFEPFFSTKPPGEGTGLGLSVSYFIITSNHKGTIEVESEPGAGTTFTIRLPLV